MDKIGFIGAYDKTNLIMYVSKVLTELGKKVLVIDSTTNQKAKYIVPTINPTTTYITEYEGMDVAVGFFSFESLAHYIGIEDINESGYDFVLIDIDNPDMVEKFEIESATINYFITAFDIYSLKRGIEILSGVKMPISITKVLFSKQVYKEDDEYLNYLSLGTKIVWNEDKIYFLLNLNDQALIAENQKMAKIKFKSLSSEYKDAMMYMVEQITKENNSSSIKKIFKQI